MKGAHSPKLTYCVSRAGGARVASFDCARCAAAARASEPLSTARRSSFGNRLSNGASGASRAATKRYSSSCASEASGSFSSWTRSRPRRNATGRRSARWRRTRTMTVGGARSGTTSRPRPPGQRNAVALKMRTNNATSRPTHDTLSSSDRSCSG